MNLRHPLPAALIGTAIALVQPAAQAFNLDQLKTQAQQMTVRIEGQDEPGSGIIIAQKGRTYTVLTAYHVIENTKPGEEIVLYTHDGAKHSVDIRRAKPTPAQSETEKESNKSIDLALIEFESDRSYPVATLSNYDYPIYENRDYQRNSASRSELHRTQIERNQHFVFTAGFPNIDLGETNRAKGFVLSAGRLMDTSASAISNPDARFQSYELVYSNMTYPGMSGGPIFDVNGRVIGMHGRSDGRMVGGDNKIEAQYLEDSGAKERVRLGLSLGIPVKTFLRWASRYGMNIDRFKIESSAPGKTSSVSTAWRAPNPFEKLSNYQQNPFYWVENGNQLWRLGQLQAAQHSYDRALQVGTGQLRYLALFAKGFAYGFEQDYQSALKYCNDAIAAHPNPNNFYEGWRCKAAASMYLQDFAGAIQAFNEAVRIQQKLSPKKQNPSDFVAIAELLFAQQQYRGALVKLDEAIQIRRAQQLGDSALIYNSRALILMMLERYEEGLADSDRAAMIKPDYSTAWNTKGMILRRMGKLESAIAAYNKAVQINPKDATAWNNRGNTFYEMGNRQEALTSFERALAADPNNETAKLNRLDLLKEMGR